jgi:photosystem II stability/assembly factor-like uncharacterized protein
MMYNGFVYRSDNKGTTWIKTNFAQVSDGANDNYRTYGRKMAVDPSNQDVVYVGTPKEGMFVTTDGGNTWTQVSAVGTSAGQGYAVAFDPSSSVVGGKTQGIYIATYGAGVYHSTNGGSTWTLTANSPKTFFHMIVDSRGEVWLGQDGYPNYFDIYMYVNGAWTSKTIGLGLIAIQVAVDPTNPNRIFTGDGTGRMMMSNDAGQTWTGVGIASITATDIPWLQYAETGNNYMALADLMFDPSSPGTLYAPAGLGVWKTNAAAITTSAAWTSQSLGIEQLATNIVISPPGGKPLVGSWDRAVFYVNNPDVFPSTYGPNLKNGLLMGWDFDYAASSPNFVAGIMNWNGGAEESGYSTDGGQTWIKFPSAPADVVNLGKIGGSIAVSSPTNIVWVPNNTSQPYYTKDGGKTWIASPPPGTLASDAGWGWAYYFNRHVVAADRVLPGVFYAYNPSYGLFRSNDGGASWALIRAGEIANVSYYNSKIKSVPDHAGHLFFTSGAGGGPNHPQNSQFMHSTDGGLTWNAIPNALEVLNFGFGKAKVAGGYPSIYIAGWVNNVYGIWQSDNEGQSWTQIGKWPTGSLANIAAISGDMNQYGRVYVALAGDGFVYGDISGVGTISPPPPPPPPPAPTPTPPPTLTPSANGTRVPPTSQIVDNSNNIWTISGGAILKNGQQAGDGRGTTITWCGSQIRALGTDNNWYLWTGTVWTGIGTTDPCVTVSPTPTPTPTPTPPPPTPTPPPVVPPPSPTPTPTPTPTPGTFGIGARVKTTANLNVRNKASTKTGKILCIQPAGALGSITQGPTSNQGFTWWNINYDTGCDGWSVQSYLTTSLTSLPITVTNTTDVAQLQALIAQLQAILAKLQGN